MGVAALLLVAPGVALAQNDCSGAQEDYNRVVNDLSRDMRSYWRCISESNGRNDCMLEFKRLERQQKRFDDEILSLRIRCNPERNRSRGGDPTQG
jgi:hypothetical protein